MFLLVEAGERSLGCEPTQSVGREERGLELKSVYSYVLVWTRCLGFLLVQLVGAGLRMQEARQLFLPAYF
jgi:hypothetical protein